MNLGRIYSLEKDLYQTKTFADLAKYEVMGLVWRTEYSNGDMLEMFDSIKNEFLSNYSILLKEAKLKEASYFWDNLVSSKKLEQGKKHKVKLNGEFYNQLSNWLHTSGKLKDLQPILSDMEIEISNDLDKYSLIYGLKVLLKLGDLLGVQIDESQKDKQSQNLSEESIDPKFMVKSIAITTSIYESLFNSCGIPSILIGQKDREEIKGRIESLLEEFPKVKIALIMGLSQFQESYLNRQFGKKLQICSIPTGSTSPQDERVNTFEKIGVSTIGLRPSKIIKQNSK